MRIGFDAKRAFHNDTGLGNYSRTLLQSLARLYPEHEYLLFNPRPSSRHLLQGDRFLEIRPSGPLDARFPGLWRSRGMVNDLKKWRIDLYHGLSHEIPVGIGRTGIPSVVTIHDLIHERYPRQYPAIDGFIYRRKFRYACRHADRIIAISRQTRTDIVNFYGIAEERISVCYQSCHPAFSRTVPEPEKKELRVRYGLPDAFLLYVGSIIERKNLLTICKALQQLGPGAAPPLVVVGQGGAYKKKVKAFIAAAGLGDRVIFLSDDPRVHDDPGYQTPDWFAALYQSAACLIYPSFFEGFGLPVLEALWSRVPVITAQGSCLNETGGPGSWYVDPARPEEIADGIRTILGDVAQARSMTDTGWLHAQQFAPERTTAAVMDLYRSLLG